ncbi:PTR2-domain-containing protein [Linderina pennispora]|uniref:PTR2-domain-containing protein n=1 Tax=Linderina pennispora TaxID=61395 RepID=A0A1Y1WHH9_9FUNG|nr:PTR2-domain-containing protein [Linderina pennispora]ORX72922.1 PTR2-domain-containing protein [Linderina pennispora]
MSLSSEHDSIHKEDLHPDHPEDYLREGERWATEEDMNTLRRVSDRLPIAAIFVVLTEFCERFTYYGITGPFQNYIQNDYKIPGSDPGAINGGQSMATGLGNFFQFWCYPDPDFWCGYCRPTILLFGCIYTLGDLILTLTSIPASIRHGGALPGLIIAMITIGLGTGGIKSNVSPMVAEQYGRYRPFVRKRKDGTEVVVDREVTVQSIFNWFYWSINVGGLSAIATTEMEAKIDFWPAFLLPTCMFVVCVTVFYLGRNQYVITKPTGSIILKAYRVIRAGIKNHKAAKAENRLIPSYNVAGLNMDWDDKFVEELSVAVRASKIFLCYPVFWLCYGQMSNNLVSQSGQMITGKVPNDIMQNIDPLVIIILIPFFDRLIYPGFRRCGLELRPVTRITLGFTFAAVAMAYAAVVQHFIYKTGPWYEYPSQKVNGVHHSNNDITAAIQVPCYILYAYKKAPESMKSIIMSLFLLTNAGGSILAFCFNSISTNPHLVKNFAIVGGLMGGFTVLFYDQDEYLGKLEFEKN